MFYNDVTLIETRLCRAGRSAGMLENLFIVFCSAYAQHIFQFFTHFQTFFFDLMSFVFVLLDTTILAAEFC